ncbi:MULTISPECIES: hypothetical protein [Actinomycetes]|uniref:Secreted protein n=2 Tax=Actinomycetes TaxID=1760 RepID=A0ABP5YSM0_9ACTN|nr:MULTISPECIES: hypothetical protein [Streptomyces]MYQ99921.1 hypothetical protein [Streptomyces sp. SID6139]MYR21271.1 hypothetical protein [Streptomyces sp. SID6137]TGZ15914.1 hypothetical protein DV517_08870 [Streptomyces sp. S816]WDO06498.1 hypothetical protein ME763_12915 [Streptomyces murinus]
MLKRLAVTVLVAAATLTVQPLAQASAAGTGATVECSPGGGAVLLSVHLSDAGDLVSTPVTNGVGDGHAGLCGDTSWGG